MKSKQELKDLRSLSLEDLRERISKAQKETMTLGFRKAIGQLEGVEKVPALRKSIARMKTIENQKRSQVQ